MQVSIIMPTYNDANSIEKSIASVINQTLTSWELIIIDDGSTDNTMEIIKSICNNKIKYIYQENKDQLNAIINGLQYASGEYIYILHSDDLIYDEKTLEKCVNYMNKNKDLDSIIANLEIIDDNDKVTGIQRILEFNKKEAMLPLQLLWLGRNLYVDVGFHRRESYMNKIQLNYLNWNTPFWINFSNKTEILNVKKVNFIFYKYRIHENNYIMSEIGKLNVINGELRTAIQLMKDYYIPFYKFQYVIFRVLNRLKIKYKPMYMKKEQKQKSQIIKFIIKKRFGKNYLKNSFLKSLIYFYKNNDVKRSITIKKLIKDEDVFYGKDIRSFNEMLSKNKIDKFYKEFLDEMQKGFNKIIVKNENDKNKMINICKFLCIYNEVKIEISK